MSQAWSPLERSEPDLRLWSLDVVALLRSEDEEATSPSRGDVARRVRKRFSFVGRGRREAN